jgi:hypothetical protein
VNAAPMPRAELCAILDRLGYTADYGPLCVTFPREAWDRFTTEMRWIAPMPEMWPGELRGAPCPYPTSQDDQP